MSSVTGEANGYPLASTRGQLPAVNRRLALSSATVSPFFDVAIEGGGLYPNRSAKRLTHRTRQQADRPRPSSQADGTIIGAARRAREDATAEGGPVTRLVGRSPLVHLRGPGRREAMTGVPVIPAGQRSPSRTNVALTCVAAEFPPVAAISNSRCASRQAASPACRNACNRARETRAGLPVSGQDSATGIDASQLANRSSHRFDHWIRSVPQCGQATLIVPSGSIDCMRQERRGIRTWQQWRIGQETAGPAKSSTP